VARALHRAWRRSAAPFVSRSAATFTESLFEAELFGSAKGFPDARSPERIGLVGVADGGTLFLDEIGELP
jgi:DNA-binding NtrC family response regulator